MREFSQVDVFSADPMRGNPVAVVHGADGLTEEQMQLLARWTNLSETTFLLMPVDPAADYRLRIFTPGSELPFAGHPTLGSAHAWLAAGGVPARDDVVVQECGAGLVEVRRSERLALAAPPLVRSGPVCSADLSGLVACLGLAPDDIVDAAWVDNGPGWVGLLLPSAETVLGLRPDLVAMGAYKVGVVGPHPPGSEVDVEVRAFVPSLGIGEDPVTGSLNAGLGMWLAGTRLPSSYLAAQGTAIGRRGRVHVSLEDGQVWVAGDTTTLVTGTIDL